jgi:hypothetical protein
MNSPRDKKLSTDFLVALSPADTREEKKRRDVRFGLRPEQVFSALAGKTLLRDHRSIVHSAAQGHA